MLEAFVNEGLSLPFIPPSDEFSSKLQLSINALYDCWEWQRAHDSINIINNSLTFNISDSGLSPVELLEVSSIPGSDILFTSKP